MTAPGPRPRARAPRVGAAGTNAAGTNAAGNGAQERAVATTGRAVGLAVAIAAVAILPTLGRQPLSWDEAVTRTAARRSFSNLAGELAHTDLPLGAYYLVMHAWLSLLDAVHVPVTEVGLRLPSAAAALGAVAMLVVLTSRWFGPARAALAGALLAVHPLLTFYAQDARPYTLVTSAFLLSTWALVRALDRPSTVRSVTYGALATLTVYLHLFAVFAFAAHVLLVRRRARERTRWLVIAASVMAAAAPLALLARTQAAEVRWIPRPTPVQVAQVLGHLVGGPVFAAVAVTAGATAILRHRAPPSGWAGFLAAWAVIPPVALVLVDLVTPDLVARYGLVAVPAMTALLALATTRIGGRTGAAFAAAALMTAAITTGVQQSKPFKYEDYRAATDAIADAGRPGDAVLFAPASVREGYDAYAVSQPDLRGVRDIALAAGGQPQRTDEIGGVDRASEQVARLVRSAPTVFLLGDRSAAPGAVARRWLGTFRVRGTYRWGGLELTVWRPA